VSEKIAKLEKEGWVRQFEANEPRLSEAVEMYRESGFEVHLESIDASLADPNSEDCQSCRACFQGVEDQYRIIFTRKKKDPEQEDDLFD